MNLTSRAPYLSILFLLTSLYAITLQAQTPKTYTDSFRGGDSRSSAGSKVTIVGQASDALPGYLTLTLNFNVATGNIEAGEWTLTVTRQNTDGSSSETGRLKGMLSEGTITLNRQGSVASINGIQLTVKNGTGIYAHIISGQGTFAGISQVAKNLPPFVGTLILTF